MPGFFIHNANESIRLRNYDDSRCFQGSFEYKEWKIQWNSLDKFRNDKLFFQDDELIVVFDGIVFNKESLMKKTRSVDWKNTIKALYYEDRLHFCKLLRGCFSGAILEKKSRRWVVFTDQIANHSVFVYMSGGKIAVGSQMNYFSDWMKANKIQRTINKRWIDDILSFGYVIDTHAILEGVNRVFPGSTITIFPEQCQYEEIQYYSIHKKNVECSEEIWIEKLEEAFQQAVDRIVNKCKEDGCSLLVDISGGLDSRMIAAHISEEDRRKAMGITYAQSGSRDQVIAFEVARALSLPLLYYPMDGGDCLRKIDDFVFMNQGMNYFSAITGGKEVLESMDRRVFGMEIWGILGDVHEGAMITENVISAPKWDYDRFRTSQKFPVYNFEGYDRDYSDNEMLWFYLRGVFGGQNTAFIRQNFVECPAPYGDVDYLNLLFSIPYEMRTKGCLLRKWMIKKYPLLSSIKYSGTGTRVLESNERERFFSLPGRMRGRIHRLIRSDGRNSMNPVDHWLNHDGTLKIVFDTYYQENKCLLLFDQRLKDAVEILYCSNDSNSSDKIVALTVISAVKQYVLD